MELLKCEKKFLKLKKCIELLLSYRNLKNVQQSPFPHKAQLQEVLKVASKL
jgi:hypothetical protein